MLAKREKESPHSGGDLPEQPSSGGDELMQSPTEEKIVDSGGEEALAHTEPDERDVYLQPVWQSAIREELKSLEDAGTFERVHISDLCTDTKALDDSSDALHYRSDGTRHLSARYQECIREGFAAGDRLSHSLSRSWDSAGHYSEMHQIHLRASTGRSELV